MPKINFVIRLVFQRFGGWIQTTGDTQFSVRASSNWINTFSSSFILPQAELMILSVKFFIRLQPLESHSNEMKNRSLKYLRSGP